MCCNTFFTAAEPSLAMSLAFGIYWQINSSERVRTYSILANLINNLPVHNHLHSIKDIDVKVIIFSFSYSIMDVMKMKVFDLYFKKSLFHKVEMLLTNLEKWDFLFPTTFLLASLS